MKCIECDRIHYLNSRNSTIENLLDISLDVTKLLLELSIKIDLYYKHSKQCYVCNGVLCYTHSKVINYYKEDGYMYFNYCTSEYYTVYHYRQFKRAWVVHPI